MQVEVVQSVSEVLGDILKVAGCDFLSSVWSSDLTVQLR
jgi:hypothetical protein